VAQESGRDLLLRFVRGADGGRDLNGKKKNLRSRFCVSTSQKLVRVAKLHGKGEGLTAR